jgi:serine/threonine protein kinase
MTVDSRSLVSLLTVNLNKTYAIISQTNVDFQVVPGQMLCHYKVEKLIGQGSFGQVVKATNTHSNQLVAIKIIKNKPNFTLQAQSEIQILHLLNSNPDSRFVGFCNLSSYND